MQATRFEKLSRAARRILAGLSAALAIGVALPACTTTASRNAAIENAQADGRLHSVLWQQTSAEYANTTLQIFHMAERRLKVALVDTGINALPGDVGGPDKPLAIIVDVDETILDNSAHAARAILAREGFERDLWHRWVKEASAPPVPGAVEFLAAARSAGVHVFYVTNRHHELEAATRRNLEELGIVLEADEDVILTRDERPDWTHDKTSRRRYVAEGHRVIQLVGDDLNDFVAVPQDATVGQRRQLAEQNHERWGETWFQIPNPVYGSWERAITPNGTPLSEASPADMFRMLDTD